MKMFGMISILFFLLGSTTGCGQRTSTVDVPPPVGTIVFQPQFHFADGTTAQQGTGFFAEGPNGALFGVTSSHFLDFNGPQMIAAEWVTVADGVVATKFVASYGVPKAQDGESPDRRTDHFMVLGEDVSVPHLRMILDERNMPEVGERIWFPNKTWETPAGHTMVAGTVEESTQEYSVVELDELIVLQSQSGSPIISQLTGKVIGTLSGGHDDGVTYLTLCPSHAILGAMTAGAKSTRFEKIFDAAK
jgi:hypothetical protein